jgi:cobalamin-dependent methionine synthase I
MVSEVSVNVEQILQARNNTLTLNIKEGDAEKNTVTIILSCNKFNIIDSWFSIGKILFICLIIVYLLNTFNTSITQLITEPIERMLEEVKQNGKSDIIEFDEN